MKTNYIALAVLVLVAVIVAGGAYFLNEHLDTSVPTAVSVNSIGSSSASITPQDQPAQASVSSQQASLSSSFKATPLSGLAPLTVTFTNIPVTAVEEDFSFGDGQEISNVPGNATWGAKEGGSVAHTYMKPGVYTAVLMGGLSVGELGRFTITVSNPNKSEPLISIREVSEKSVAVTYAGLSSTNKGPTPPRYLYVQNDGLGSATLKIPLDGSPAGDVTFSLPSSAMPGNYTVTPVGIPTDKNAPCGIGDCRTSYINSSGAILHASFHANDDGTLVILGD